VVLISSLLFIVTFTVAVRVHREKADTGKEGLIGKQAKVISDLDHNGQVFVRGEYWNARSTESVQKGDNVVVVSVDGLTLIVKKKES
jgi:membrane-bound serine protease (ClpP class)